MSIDTYERSKRFHSFRLGQRTAGRRMRKAKETDIVGRVYEYFLGKFASAEGKRGGEFYTPGCIVNLIADMIEPYKGKIYDPCCGSGGMFESPVFKLL